VTLATRFQVGERVRSLVTAQGLEAGAVYTVRKVEAHPSPFGGTFAVYWLQRDGARTLRIVNNGHLVLEAVTANAEQQTQTVAVVHVHRRDGRSIESPDEAFEAGNALYSVVLQTTCGVERRELCLGTYLHLPSALGHAWRFARDHKLPFDKKVLP